MASGKSSPVIQFIHQIARPRSADDSSDGQLLERFANQRDPSAFETLVVRHGPMVLGVCQSVLNDVHDAEDAFQATFLVLVRKAGAIGKPQSVASWLHGVAYRLAVHAKADLARRRMQERQVPTMPPADPLADLIWQDLRPVLHEEVNRLPKKYRAPFVLCYLEGKTNEQAAQLLGCPKGTVLSSLSRAREQLRRRLTRRGLTLSSGLLATVLAHNTASAAVPGALASATVKAALSLVGGEAVGAGVISVSVSALTQGMLKTMFLTKLKIAATVCLTASAAGVGVGLLTHPALAIKQPDTSQWTRKVDPPKQGKDQNTDAANKAAQEKDAAKEDQEKLLGTWECTFARIDDNPLAEDTRRQLRLVMTRDRYTTKSGDQRLFEGSYRLDPTAKPKTIDIIALEGDNKGKAALGIYAINEDTLQICYTMGQERPKAFRSPRGSGAFLTIWKRVKP
jgi:RNA polymerase sigma factor (sigma-70 family)